MTRNNTTEETRQIITSDLRNTLKNIIRTEIDRLPETLAAMEPKERLNVLLKLMPYVFPKVEAVSSSSGEPFRLEGW